MNLFVILSCCVAQTLTTAPKLDGIVRIAEYGSSVGFITKPDGDVSVRFARHRGYLFIAAEIPDSSYYWGDDLVISIDPDGSGGSVPSAGDRQWYIRRTTDSSVVVVAPGVSGRWYSAQPAVLGMNRAGDEWELASSSSQRGWIIELRIRESILDSHPRIAFRTYDDKPQGWWTLPKPPENVPAQRVERTPDYWLPLVLR